MEKEDKKTILRSSTAKTCLGFLLLATGCLIYLLFRSKTLYIYVWCKSLGLSACIDTLRYGVLGWSVPDFVKFSLPDGLYCASYLFIMDAIWHEDQGWKKYIVLAIVPVATIGSELLQGLDFVRGTFDILDLLCYSIPPIIYFLSYLYSFIYNKSI